MAVQVDDKIVCAGINDYKLQAVRYLPDGKIDSSFGNNGILYPQIPETNPQITSLVLQPDQKILLSCDCYKNGVPTIVLLRLLPDGSFDKNFGINGIVDSTFGIGESNPHVALQPDGKIFVLGWYYPGFIVIRFNADGSLDESFGDKGKVLTTFGAGTLPAGIAIAPDGKIVTAGNYGGGVGYSKFLLARYTTEGALDEDFGNKGVITTDFGKYGDVINDMAIQPDGKIIVAGQTGLDFDFQHEFIAVARYTLDGILDETFGQSGKATIIYEGFDASAEKMILDQNNNVLLAGEIYQLFSPVQDFLVSRLTNIGIIDSSFGDGGFTITNFGLIEVAHSLAFQNNKIILAGTSYSSDEETQINYALARYSNDGSKKQVIIAKIRKWLQHHNGIEWDNNSNISSFVVQRSYDGVHFSSIARIHAGNTSNYTYADPSPLTGINYYRLQTTGITGAVNYSNVLAITNNNIKISPNPATNALHIEGLPPAGNVKLTIVDFAGNVKLQAVANVATYNLNIASLKQGNYMLKIETNDAVITRQFVKE